MKNVTLKTSDDLIAANNSASGMTIWSMVIANTTASRRLVRIHHVGQGQSSAELNALLYDVAIAPLSSLVFDMRISLFTGDSLRGKADAAGVTVTMYGGMG